MSATAAGKKIVFRHGTFNTHPVLASAALLCLLAVALIAALTLRSWLFVTVLCFFALSLYGSVVYLKFEIWESGFSFSSLSRRRVFEFAQIADVLFETAKVGEGYSSPVFSLRLKVYNRTWWEERVEAVSMAAATVWREFLTQPVPPQRM